jgi:hypothetical protein
VEDRQTTENSSKLDVFILNPPVDETNCHAVIKLSNNGHDRKFEFLIATRKANGQLYSCINHHWIEKVFINVFIGFIQHKSQKRQTDKIMCMVI